MTDYILIANVISITWITTLICKKLIVKDLLFLMTLNAITLTWLLRIF